MNGQEQNNEVWHYYGDIIDRPHHRSSTRPKMSMVDRAAQFSPFAALTGHGAAIRETARLTEQHAELTEDARALLDRQLDLLVHAEQPAEEISVTYFRPDEKKEGGAYIVHTDVLRRVDPYRRELLMWDGTRIPIDRIVRMESKVFSLLDR